MLEVTLKHTEVLLQQLQAIQKKENTIKNPNLWISYCANKRKKFQATRGKQTKILIFEQKGEKRAARIKGRWR